NSNNGMMIEQNDDARTLVWETLFMYNQLDGRLYGLLAKEYKQEDKVFTITMNTDAKWSDGEALTAKDAQFTFELHRDMNTGQASMWDYLESVEATDDATLVITASSDNYNPLKVLEILPKMYVLPEHQMSKLVERNDEEPDKVKTDKNEDYIGSGPYRHFYDDETKIVLERDDNYWGQADSMWGALPAPRFIAHNMFADNNAGAVALQQGEVDVSQQFMPEIWKMWEDEGLPVSTYIDEPPYYLSASLPTAIFNLKKPGLDNVAVRKAIAMATDYVKIANNAMSGYTPLMSDVKPSMMSPSEVEQWFLDGEKLADLQWEGSQIEEAKALLDEAGIVDSDGDGFRELDGEKLSFTVECPTGWTDWNAALEMVAAAGQEIGLDITTYFPEATVWTEDMQTGNFDIIMNTYAGASIANPWTRSYQTLYSEHGKLTDADRVYSNYGRFENKRADEIIDEIPRVTNDDELKDLYTELNEIYLTEVPCFALMYRPGLFHTVNETVWTGFPEADDGTNIPPACCTDGYGIASLYRLTNVE
ncbi:MAG TPA: ABC transporter substrate-binding protein, partial [Clostridia bacterium]|nr:ABC transporter substrate-binding protein [Clostridia bacterium]